MIEEKKQRDHLLQLNQILAQQVMEKSKAVACKLILYKNMKEFFFHMHEFFIVWIFVLCFYLLE